MLLKPDVTAPEPLKRDLKVFIVPTKTSQRHRVALREKLGCNQEDNSRLLSSLWSVAVQNRTTPDTLSSDGMDRFWCVDVLSGCLAVCMLCYCRSCVAAEELAA